MFVRQTAVFSFASLPLIGCFLLAMHIYLPNMGGNGLSFPVNLTAWTTMASALLMISLSGLSQRHWMSSPQLKWLGLAAVLYTLPLFWSAHTSWQLAALPRVVGLWGGVIFYAALLQVPLRTQQRHLWMLLILMAALTESGLALLQLWVLDTNNWMEYDPAQRPYAIFQQVNTLGSFIATGYAIALLLWLRGQSSLIRSLSVIALILLPFVLTLIHSRIGWMGALAVAAGYGLLHWRRTRLWYALLLSAAGITAALLYQALASDAPDIDKAGSDLYRLELLRVALMMIMERPLLGWGYGGYSWQTARFPDHTLNNAELNHPHNELLFGWLEGGVVALVAMIIIGLTVLRPLCSLRWRRQLPWLLPLLPIALHTQTEFPLYQSAVHWMTLILLVRVATPEALITQHTASRPALIGIHTAGTIAACAALLFFITSYQTQAQLTQQERQGLSDSQALANVPTPWATPERWAFDYHMALLQQYNRTQAPHLLETFSQWGREYLQLRNDPNIYRYLLMIARHQQRTAEAHQLQATAHALFPNDPSFFPLISPH